MQSEFVTGYYGISEDHKKTIDDFQKISHYVVSLFLYVRISSTNQENTIPLLQTLKPYYQLTEDKGWTTDEKDSLLKRRPSINYTDRSMWDVKTQKWEVLQENMELFLTVTDYKKAIEVKGENKKDGDDFMFFCNDFMTVRSKDAKNVYVLYIGYTNGTKKPLKNAIDDQNGVEVMSYENIGTLHFNFIAMEALKEDKVTQGKTQKQFTLKLPKNEDSTNGKISFSLTDGKTAKTIMNIQSFNDSVQYASGSLIIERKRGTPSPNEA